MTNPKTIGSPSRSDDVDAFKSNTPDPRTAIRFDLGSPCPRGEDVSRGPGKVTALTCSLSGCRVFVAKRRAVPINVEGGTALAPEDPLVADVLRGHRSPAKRASSPGGLERVKAGDLSVGVDAAEPTTEEVHQLGVRGHGWVCTSDRGGW